MSNLNPLKYCFRGKHSKPRATFRMFPGVENTRAAEARVPALRSRHHDPLEGRPVKNRPLQNRPLESGQAKVGTEKTRAGGVHLRAFGGGEIGASGVHVSKERFLQVGAAQLRTRQVRRYERSAS